MIFFFFFFFFNFCEKETCLAWTQPKTSPHSQTSRIRHFRRNPRISGQEIPDRKLPGLRRARQNPIARPVHPPSGGGAGAGVHILGIIKRAESKIPTPRKPALGINQSIKITLHDDRPRVLLPWPAQIRLERALDRPQVRRRRDTRVVDDNSCVLVRIGPGLSRDGVTLAAHRLSDEDVAVLKNGDGVATDEVDGAVDVAVAVELALRVDVQGVLVALEAAAVEDRVVGARPEGHGLVFRRSGGVLEGYVLSDEAVPRNP